MNVLHVTIDGQRTTASIPPFLAAVIWADGFDTLDGWAQSIVDESPELWHWSREWSDTVSGRLVACALRKTCRVELVQDALTLAHAA